MRYSVTVVATDTTIGVPRLAREVEDRHLDGLWLPDHTHVPVNREDMKDIPPGFEERYQRMVEPITALAAAASATSSIRLGTGILCAALRDPIVTAKALATLDNCSSGRLVVGIGYGWHRTELSDHGVELAERHALTREHVLAMQQLWENDVAEFRGRFFSLAPSLSWPKPVQKPLPVLIGGGSSDRTFSQIAEFGHGWIPTGGKNLRSAVARLREHFEGRGRKGDGIEVIPFTSIQLDHTKIDHFASSGATETAFDLPSANEVVVMRALDDIARFVQARK